MEGKRMMAAVSSPELEARRRRLDELFEDEPYLSATMRASRLHEREAPGETQVHLQEVPLNLPHVVNSNVTRLGFVVNVRQEAGTLQAEIRPEESDVMTAAEAAHFLKVGKGTLRRLSREVGLPFAQVGRSRRYRKTALLRWLKTHEEVHERAA
jgi:excisionase family DNA binding protein